MRELLRPWLVAQINSGKYPGLQWIDQEKTIFMIPWTHALNKTWKPEDCKIFQSWSENTGKFVEGVDEPEYATMKTRLRCALNNAPDFTELPRLTNLRCSRPYRVYKLLSEKSSRTERKKKWAKSKSAQKIDTKSYPDLDMLHDARESSLSIKGEASGFKCGQSDESHYVVEKPQMLYPDFQQLLPAAECELTCEKVCTDYSRKRPLDRVISESITTSCLSKIKDKTGLSMDIPTDTYLAQPSVMECVQLYRHPGRRITESSSQTADKEGVGQLDEAKMTEYPTDGEYSRCSSPALPHPKESKIADRIIGDARFFRKRKAVNSVNTDTNKRLASAKKCLDTDHAIGPHSVYNNSDVDNSVNIDLKTGQLASMGNKSPMDNQPTCSVDSIKTKTRTRQPSYVDIETPVDVCQIEPSSVSNVKTDIRTGPSSSIDSETHKDTHLAQPSAMDRVQMYTHPEHRITQNNSQTAHKEGIGQSAVNQMKEYPTDKEPSPCSSPALSHAKDEAMMIIVTYHGTFAKAMESLNPTGCRIYYAPPNKAGTGKKPDSAMHGAKPGLKHFCLPNPDGFIGNFVEHAKALLGYMERGIELQCEGGDIYAERSCKCTIYYSSVDTEFKSVKLQRNQRVKVFNYKDVFLSALYSCQSTCDGRPDPAVYFFCGQEGDHNYLDQVLIAFKVTSVKAQETLEINQRASAKVKTRKRQVGILGIDESRNVSRQDIQPITSKKPDGRIIVKDSNQTRSHEATPLSTLKRSQPDLETVTEAGEREDVEPHPRKVPRKRLPLEDTSKLGQTAISLIKESSDRQSQADSSDRQSQADSSDRQSQAIDEQDSSERNIQEFPNWTSDKQSPNLSDSTHQSRHVRVDQSESSTNKNLMRMTTISQNSKVLLRPDVSRLAEDKSPRNRLVKNYGCSECGDQFETEDEFDGHTQFHARLASYRCTYCSEKLKSRDQLNSHVRARHIPAKYECRKCECVFKTRTTLSVHMQEHHDELPFTCCHCEAKFSDEYVLDHHINWTCNKTPGITDNGTHSKRPTIYICSYCSAIFKHKSVWRIHERTHSGQERQLIIPSTGTEKPACIPDRDTTSDPIYVCDRDTPNGPAGKNRNPIYVCDRDTPNGPAGKNRNPIYVCDWDTPNGPNDKGPNSVYVCGQERIPTCPSMKIPNSMFLSDRDTSTGLSKKTPNPIYVSDEDTISNPDEKTPIYVSDDETNTDFEEEVLPEISKSARETNRKQSVPIPTFIEEINTDLEKVDSAPTLIQCISMDIAEKYVSPTDVAENETNTDSAVEILPGIPKSKQRTASDLVEKNETLIPVFIQELNTFLDEKPSAASLTLRQETVKMRSRAAPGPYDNSRLSPVFIVKNRLDSLRQESYGGHDSIPMKVETFVKAQPMPDIGDATYIEYIAVAVTDDKINNTDMQQELAPIINDDVDCATCTEHRDVQYNVKRQEPSPVTQADIPTDHERSDREENSRPVVAGDPAMEYVTLVKDDGKGESDQVTTDDVNMDSDTHAVKCEDDKDCDDDRLHPGIVTEEDAVAEVKVIGKQSRSTASAPDSLLEGEACRILPTKTLTERHLPISDRTQYPNCKTDNKNAILRREHKAKRSSELSTQYKPVIKRSFARQACRDKYHPGQHRDKTKVDIQPCSVCLDNNKCKLKQRGKYLTAVQKSYLHRHQRTVHSSDCSLFKKTTALCQ